MTVFSRSAIFAIALMCSSTAYGAADANEQDADAVGVVFKQSGRWVMTLEEKKEERPLSVGDGIPGGWKVKRLSTSGQLIVGMDNGLKVHCPPIKSGEPDLRKSPHTSNVDPSFASCVCSVVARLFVKGHTRYAITIARGGERNFVRAKDSVLEISNSTIDLSSIFPPNELRQVALSISSLDPARQFTSGPINLDLSKKEALTFSNPKISPGLYKVTFLEALDPLRKTGEEAWLLVSDSTQIKTNQESVFQASRVIDKWAESATVEMKRGLLRAYMESLANPKDKLSGVH